MGTVSERFLELLHHLKHERAYKKRTEIALELVQKIEEEDNFPDANSLSCWANEVICEQNADNVHVLTERIRDPFFPGERLF